MRKSYLALCLMAILALTACGSDKQESAPAAGSEGVKKTITFGVVEPSLPVLEAALPYIESKGYKLDIHLIEGNVNVIRAVNDGGVEAGLGVHKKFMEKFNADNNGDLVMVTPYAYYGGMGLYSDKFKSVEEFPEGAKIAIMNDAMNMDRAMRILEDAGLITLASKDGVYTTLDVVGNPKNIELIDMDQIQTVRALQDLDAAVVFFSHMNNAGRDCRTYIIKDKIASEYPSAIVVKKGSEETEWAKTLEEGLRSEPVRKYIEETYVGVYEFY